MVKVIVLGLSGCGHCETLVNRLEEERIPFSFLDADKEGKLADKLEALLDTETYPIVILENSIKKTFLYRVNSINEAKTLNIGEDTKVGCVTIDNMVASIKQHFK
jgi:glutaredoxin